MRRFHPLVRWVSVCLIAVVIGASACVFGPAVECRQLTDDDCQRAVALALEATRGDGTPEQVLAYRGCWRWLECSARQVELTIKVEVDVGDRVLGVTIPRAEWTAGNVVDVTEDARSRD